MLRIVGAACDAELNIDEVVRIAEKANDKIWSIGVAITQNQTGHLNAGITARSGGADFIEYGIGLHGERGILRTELQPVDQLVDKMYSQFMDEANLKKGDEVCVLVNGLGSISIMELSIVFRRVKKLLEGDGLRLYDADINNYCSRYESTGFSITLFKIDAELKSYYNSPCYSPYYSHKIEAHKANCQEAGPKASLAVKRQERAAGHSYVPAEKGSQHLTELNVLLLRDMMIHAADRLVEAGDLLSGLDSIIGDGDHGICIANGMTKAKQRLMDITEKNAPGDVYQIIGKTMLLLAGGAAGVFFGCMYTAAAESVKNKSKIKVSDFAQMWSAALSAIQEKGGARRGQKTMVDALAPAVDALAENTGKDFLYALKVSEKASEQGMLDTKSMTAKFGRGKFLSDRALGCQDAGATTIWITFKSMREYMEKPN
jgi:dihydroxyacetone kinase